MMSAYDNSFCDEGLRQYDEKESPPFALDDNFSSPQEQRQNTFDRNISDSSKSTSSQEPAETIEIESKNARFVAASCKKESSVMLGYSQYSSTSAPPDLAESTMTDETSCCSTFSSPRSEASRPIDHDMKASPSPSFSHHTSIMSSIISTSSMTSVPLEPRMPSDFYAADNGSFKASSASFIDSQRSIGQSGINSRSIGFSELMKAADDSNMKLEASGPTMHVSNHRSIGRLPPLPEYQEAECGTLISAATHHETSDPIPMTAERGNAQNWWQNVPFLSPGHGIGNGELSSPLLTSTNELSPNGASFEQMHITRLLSNGSNQEQRLKLALERASASVQTNVESDDSFEVVLLLEESPRCTVDDVVEVIGNVNLLNLWCNPIESLIVTSNSSEGSSIGTSLGETRIDNERENLNDSVIDCEDKERIREYEAEWIEATTSSLESPSFVLNAGQAVLQSLGCASYGKITMFIERPHGRISLDVGPFNGGICASHSISVSSEDSSYGRGRTIRIVDRVRLTHDNEEEGFFLGKIFGCAVGSCLGSCFSPPIVGYVDQVAMSMARLRILLESSASVRSSNCRV